MVAAFTEVSQCERTEQQKRIAIEIKPANVLTKFLVIALLIGVVALSVGAVSAGHVDDLAAYWKFDESSGSLASDSSAHSNDGAVNGPAFVAGKVGNALRFDGVTDHVNVNDSASLRGFDDFTFGGWFKSDSLANPNTIISKYNDPLNRHNFSLYHFSTGRVWCSLSDGTTSYNFVSAVSNSDVSVGDWHRSGSGNLNRGISGIAA